jgi:Trypsin-like peptidase domain/WD40-like Beta Propeller Repeat
MRIGLKAPCLGISLAGCLAIAVLGQEIQQAKKAVVRITSQAEGKNRVGTGFIAKLDKDAAYIVTASHVIEGDSTPKVSFYPDAETQYEATVMGTEGDLPRGLALIRVRGALPPGIGRLGIDASFSMQASEEMTIIGFPRLASTAWAVTPISIVGRQGTAVTFTGAADEGSSGSPVIRNGWVTAIVAEKSGDFGYAVPATAIRFAIEGWGLKLLPDEGTPEVGAGAQPGAEPGNEAHCGPDGRLAKTRILFVSNRDGDTSGNNSDFYLMDIDGKHVERITPKDAVSPLYPSWSRDGKSITYIVDNDAKSMGIYKTELSSGKTTALISRFAYFSIPVWSPNGEWIAFTANTGLDKEATDVFVKPSNSTKYRRLTEDKSNKVSLFWSPDGKKIGFAVDGEKSYTTFLMNADGTQLKQLSSPLTDFAGAAWSPDGKRIVGNSTRDGYLAIYSMNYDGSDPVRLTNNPKGDSDPDYSPDGCMIVFTSKRAGHEEIYVMKADGSNQVRLTSGKGSNDYPRWSPFLK